MGFLRKRLASSVTSVYATSKIYLITDKIRCGDIIKGEIEIKGGKVKQDIPLINIFLNTEYELNNERKQRVKITTIQKETIVLNTRINSEECLKIPFEFKTLENMPIETSEFGIWLEAEIDSENSMASNERSYIKVQSNKEVEEVLNVIYDLGFTIRKVQNISNLKYKNMLEHLPFYQKYEIVPRDNCFYKAISYIQLIFILNEDLLDIYIDEVEFLDKNSNEYKKIENKTKKIIFQREELKKDNILEEFSRILKNNNTQK